MSAGFFSNELRLRPIGTSTAFSRYGANGFFWVVSSTNPTAAIPAFEYFAFSSGW